MVIALVKMVGELLQGGNTCTEEDVGLVLFKWEERQVQRARGRNLCGLFLKQKGRGPVRPEQRGKGKVVPAEVRCPSDGHPTYKHVLHITIPDIFIVMLTIFLLRDKLISCHPGRVGMRISALVFLHQFLRPLLHREVQGRTC